MKKAIIFGKDIKLRDPYFIEMLKRRSYVKRKKKEKQRIKNKLRKGEYENF